MGDAHGLACGDYADVVTTPCVDHDKNPAECIIANYRNADGSVTVPEALRPYMRGIERIEAPQSVPSTQPTVA